MRWDNEATCDADTRMREEEVLPASRRRENEGLYAVTVNAERETRNEGRPLLAVPRLSSM
jgi:hypothetical protein